MAYSYIKVPSKDIPVADLRDLFNHPNLQDPGHGPRRTATLYPHLPYTRIQENLKSGDLHSQLSSITFSALRRFDPEKVTKLVFENVQNWWDARTQPVFASDLFFSLRSVALQVQHEMLFGYKLPIDKTADYARATLVIKATALWSQRKRKELFENTKQSVKVAIETGHLDASVTQGADVDLLAEHFTTIFLVGGIAQMTRISTYILAGMHLNQKILKRLDSLIDETTPQPEWADIRDHKYLDYILNEGLRLSGRGRTDRYVSNSFTFNRTHFKKGSDVLLNLLQCRKDKWDKPEEFCPERWDPTHPMAAPEELRKAHFMPFGIGQRACPAQNYSRNYIKALVVAVLRQVRLDIPKNFRLTRPLRLGVPAVVSPHDIENTGNAASLWRTKRDKLLAKLERQQGLLVKEIDEGLGRRSLPSMIKMGYNNVVMDKNFFYPLIVEAHSWVTFNIIQPIRKRGLLTGADTKKPNLHSQK